MSGRAPSTPAARQSATINSSSGSGTLVAGSRARAAAMRARSVASAGAQVAVKPAGAASKATRRRTISARRAGSRSVSTATLSPKRSSNCGRNSPSSGFIVPIRMKAAGWLTETPSRSTVLTPSAAASSSASTRWSASRLTSSIARMPRWAAASSPGSKRRSPLTIARSRSSVPSSRSSVAPIGSVTT